MTRRRNLAALLLALVLAGAQYGQCSRCWAMYEREMQNPVDDPIFHVVYHLRKRFHVPGLRIVRGQKWGRGGIGEHWRAVVDQKGRVQVAICFNMDLGDAWEWADYPAYPEPYSALAYRIGVNYIVYAMTH